MNKKGYNNNIANIGADQESFSLYGIRANFCLNSLQHFHATEGLPSDIAYDIFEKIAVDVMVDILLDLVSV